MKFAEHLSVHTTPEWRAAYINYEVLNEISFCSNIFQEIAFIANQMEFKRMKIYFTGKVNFIQMSLL